MAATACAPPTPSNPPTPATAPAAITSRDGFGEASQTSRTPATLAVTAVMSTDDGSGNRPPGA